MRLTHFGHACVLVETDSSRLLFDPGTLSEGLEQIHDLDAVLVTHEHDDHVDLDRVRRLLAASPNAVLIADEATAASVAELAPRTRTVVPGDRVTVGGAVIDVLGGAHAPVYGDVPSCPNVAYLVDRGVFLHPGDSFVRPDSPVDVLALPISGPWLKLGDAIEYLRAVVPRVAVPIHERALASTDTHHELLGVFTPEETSFRPVALGEPTVF